MAEEQSTKAPETPKQDALTKIPKAPILADDRGVRLSTLDDMYRFCVAVVNSKQFKDIETPEVALVRLQAGMELGLSYIWSLTNIMVVNGRPSVWGDSLLGLVLRHPDCEDVIETFENDEEVTDKTTAVCEVRRRGRVPVIRKFSIGDAKRAGLYDKHQSVHRNYPLRMIQMRARSWACRDGFADALRGLGVIEELRDVNGNGRKAIEVPPVEVKLPDEIPTESEAK